MKVSIHYSFFGVSLKIGYEIWSFGCLYRYIVSYSNNMLSSSIGLLYVVSDLWYNAQMHD